MAATVNWIEVNGASVQTVITTGRYASKDQYNPANAYPVVVPPSGFAYSYWKHFGLELSGSFTQCDNFRVHTSGAIKSNWLLGTGGKLMFFRRDTGDHGCPIESYEQATGVEGSTGYYGKDPVNGHDYYKSEAAEPIDADSCTSGSPLTLDTTVYTEGGTTKLLVSQLKVADDATQGDKATESLTATWNEI